MTGSITTWNRLEPRSAAVEPGPGPGLEARVYDAAWLLGRQWQLGEVQGEDAASPGLVRVRVAAAPLTRYRPDARPAGSAAIVRLAAGDLLEPTVEGDPAGADDWRSSAEMGAHLLVLLAAAQLGSLRSAFVKSYPLPDPVDAGPILDAMEAGRLRLLRRRSLDGAALRDAIRLAAGGSGSDAALPARPPVAAALRAPLLNVLRGWLAWYPAPVAAPSWLAERMEYRFTVAGPSPSGAGETVLEATEYEGGRLDWPDFRVVEGSLGGASDQPPAQTVITTIPTPVAYPGMPANRWWEFEDRRTWFGGVETEAGDLARMLLVDFATVYGNDWFMVPVELDVGSLAQVEAVVVVDTFGQATLVRPTEVARAGLGDTPWRMFGTTGGPPAFFVLPPVVGPTLDGPSREEVLFLRDETANMAWAVERKVSGPVGTVIDRYERWQARLAAVPGRGAGEVQDALTYRLNTEVPDHWIPLVPRSDGLRSIRLDRGTMVTPSGDPIPPLGRILEPERPLSIFEEEVPRSGALVTRAWQLARGPDGQTVAWLGRRKRPGRGEGSSGLAFDQLTPPRGAPDE
jgi:hypothetical protein